MSCFSMSIYVRFSQKNVKSDVRLPSDGISDRPRGGDLVFVTRGMRKKFLFKCMPFAGVEENCFEGFLGKLQVFH